MLSNIRAVLEASNSSPSAVLKTTVFLKNISDFDSFNKLYGDFFGDAKPARSLVEVSAFARDILVEIE